MIHDKLRYCIEEVLKLVVKSDGDVKNKNVPRKAMKSLIEKVGTTFTSETGIFYDLLILIAFVVVCVCLLHIYWTFVTHLLWCC